LTATASLWPDVRVAYDWVQRVAQLLTNEPQLPGAAVKRRLGGLLGALTRHQATAGALAPAWAHFRKVARSYWPGLLHCDTVPELPRTNNALEQCFGAHRYHERRATGRKVASPALGLPGSVRLIAAAATRVHPFSAQALVPEDVQRWQRLRHELATRRQHRTLRLRFRRDPVSYLATLEADFLKLSLPP
jgi:hypothetical protein